MYSKTFFVNTGFDLNLGGITNIPKALQNTISEIVLHWIIAGNSGDNLISDLELDKEYYQYLDSHSISHAYIQKHSTPDPKMQFECFGWDQEARALAANYSTPSSPPPSLSSVIKVNSKQFSSILQQKLTGNSSFVVTEIPQLQEAPFQVPWMLKSIHGNSATGNKIVSSIKESPIAWIKNQLKTHGELLIEPFDTRICDFGSTFELTPKGEILNPDYYELINTKNGTFKGIQNVTKPKLLELQKKISPAHTLIAKELHKSEYFGPVNLDSYEYRNGKTLEFRPIVEINARQSMSRIFLSIQNKIPSSTHILWEFFHFKHFNIPYQLDHFLEKTR